MSRKKRIIVIAALLAAFLLTCLTSVYLAPAPIGLRPPRPIGGTPAGKAMLPLTSSDGPGWVVYRVDRRQVIEVVGTFLGAGPTYDPVAVVRDEAGFRYYHWEHGWIGDIYDATVAAFTEDGWKFESLLVGHGVGAWWHQQEPILRRGSEIVLEDRMVLALEPHIGHWHIQDMVVVRPDGPELISDKMSTDEPFVVE